MSAGRKSQIKLCVTILSIAVLTCTLLLFGGIASRHVYAASADDIKIDAAHFPDAAFRNYVTKNFDKNSDNYLQKSERDAVTEISVSGAKFKDLKGIQYFTNLKELYCSDNQLVNLDVSNNTKLEILSCEDNHLTSLKTSNSLKALTCDHNQLTKLGVSGYKKLYYLSCANNKLMSLNLSGDTALLPDSTDEGGSKVHYSVSLTSPQTQTVNAKFQNGKYVVNLKSYDSDLDPSKVNITNPAGGTWNAKAGTLAFNANPNGKKVTYNYSTGYPNSTKYPQYKNLSVTLNITGSNNASNIATNIKNITRIYGATRYETAIKIADALKAKMGGGKFGAAVIAYGENYPDALSGTYLANVKKAPLLLANAKDASTETNTVNYVKSNVNAGGKVYLLGGSGLVSSTLEKTLKKQGYSVERLYGSDRYQTNIKILDKAGVKNGQDLLVCTGENYPDALSTSALGKPILLIGRQSQPTNAQRSIIQGKNVYIIGGTAAISDRTKNSISRNAKRINGIDRYDTSAKIAKQFCKNPTTAVLAYGQNFPDGLAGGTLAYKVNAPLLLATSNSAGNQSIADYVDSTQINSLYVLGGPRLISDSAAESILRTDPSLRTYKITYNLNGGKNNSANPATYKVTSAFTFKNPSRSGYTFDGWYTDSKYTKKITEIKKGTTGNKTLYAKWFKGVKEPYTYTIKPVLAPFNDYYIVKTNDPHPETLRFENSSGYLELSDTKFCDVNYVDVSKRRTKGGYIFERKSSDFTGGTVRVKRLMNGSYVARANTVSVAPSKSRRQYLIDTYTSKNKTFFENMDAVQEALNQLAIYPVYVIDTNTVDSEHPYLGLRCTYAIDWGCIDPVDLRNYATESLAEEAYPFALHSQSFPGLMEAVAEELDPNCTISTEGCMHWEFDVTVKVNGKSETRCYGGAGYGDDDFATSFMDARFKFDNSSSDFARNLNLNTLHSKLYQYAEKAKARAKTLNKEAEGDALSKVIGNGAWVRVVGGQYTYITREYYQGPLLNSSMSNTWVDGRHLDLGCAFEKNAKWSDHPTDDIVLTNQTYKNQYGETRTADLFYDYDKESGTWTAWPAYGEGAAYSTKAVLPDKLILTQDEVKKLVNSAKWKHNNATDPTSGYIYDTKSKPGTPFKN